MLEVVDGLDLSGVPIPFLEAYPFPAFVIVSSQPSPSRPPLISRDTDVTVREYDDVSPLTTVPSAAGPSRREMSSSTVVWGNEHWLQLIAGRSLDECLDAPVQDKLAKWVEEGTLDPLGDAADAAGLFLLELKEPATALQLAKTLVAPLASPHRFSVITSQVHRTVAAPDETGPSFRSSFSLSASGRTLSDVTSDNRDSMASSADTTSGSYFPRVAQAQRASASTSSSQSRFRSRARHRPEKPQLPPLLSAADESWALVEKTDWSQSCLGERSAWPEYMDPILSVVFQSKTPDCAWLGEDHLQFGNGPFRELFPGGAGQFGQPAREVWDSIWDRIGPLIEQCMRGIPAYRDNEVFHFKTFGDGYKLEHYHSYRYVPLVNKDGKVTGVFNQSLETTDQILAERRLNVIRDMSQQLLVARTVREYYTSVMEVLEENIPDAPFAMLYSVTRENEGEGLQVTVEARLEGSVGVPDDDPHVQKQLQVGLPAKSRSQFGSKADRISSPTLSAISVLSSGSGRIYHSSDGASWPISKALATRQCVIVEDCSELVKGYPLRIWEELPRSAIVIPICGDQSIEIPEAVLILGLNARRPLDTPYDDWIHVLRSNLASSLTSARAYESEQRRIDDQVRMERAKAAWIRGAAHDLRSPLTMISGPIEDLYDARQLDASLKPLVQTARRNVSRLTRLVNSLMDFSRLEAGRVQGRFVPTNLGDFISELAPLFRPAVERMQIDYDIRIPESQQLVWIDPTLFETIVSNLLGNALKYTERGSISIELKYGAWAEVIVSDTGIGIPEDEIALVTQWYHRATTAVHAGTEGTGLGLALVRELLKLHDGELVITSRTAGDGGEAHGSTFTARLPLAPKQLVMDEQDTVNIGAYTRQLANEAMWYDRAGDAGDGSEDGGVESTTGSGSKLSDGFMFDKDDVILLCDDNPDMRRYIKRILSPYCTVQEASNGEEALQKAVASPPNLILCDLMMPKLNGIELLREIRAHPATEIVPMIIMSAVSGDEARVDALVMGAEDYVAKPFKPKELLARVHLHLQVGKKRAKLEQLYAQRESQLMVMSDYCPSGIMRADENGHVLYANPAWRTLAGMSADEPPDLWPQFCHPATVSDLMTPWLDFLSPSSDEPMLTLEWEWANGNTVSGLFIRLDKVKGSAGLTGVIGCISDVSWMKERLLEAEKRRIEAEESKQQQELLIDLTSHEIRTPVSAILQCSSLVKENLVALKDQLGWAGHEGQGFKPTQQLLDDLEEDVEALESIYQCGLVQERIAGDVLSLARIQLDMLSLHDVEMDLRREARKVLSVFASEAKMKKIELSLEFGATIDRAQVYQIKTDPVRLGQVVTNLISNAIRFTATSDTRKITVTYNISFTPPGEDTCGLPANGDASVIPPAEDTPLWLFVSVRDTGPGLRPHELAILFRRFSQGNKMIHTQYGGSGLGLFICRKITELLGGRIEVQSELGHGSVFRFFIQTRAVKLAPPTTTSAPDLSTKTSTSSLTLGPTRSLSSRSGGSTPGTPPVDGKSDLHVLIVEDNIINQTVLKRQIIKAGKTCDVANNGLEALNLIREADRRAKRGKERVYDVVLMDLEMPVMDGLTAIRELRKAEEAGALERNIVLALTGNARQGQIDQAIAAGMDDVVIKPYVLSDLLVKMQTLSQRRDELEREAAEGQ